MDIELIELNAHIVLRDVDRFERKEEVVFPEMVIRGIRWNFVMAMNGNYYSWFLRGVDDDIIDGMSHDITVSVKALSIIYGTHLSPTKIDEKYFWGMGQIGQEYAYDRNEIHEKCVCRNTANFLIKVIVGKPEPL